jgi:hypothetical protein
MSDEWHQEYVDMYGQTWATDSNGQPLVINGERIPGKAEKKTTSSGGTYYDSSRGHCGLCGRLTCSGNCFK